MFQMLDFPGWPGAHHIEQQRYRTFPASQKDPVCFHFIRLLFPPYQMNKCIVCAYSSDDCEIFLQHCGGSWHDTLDYPIYAINLWFSVPISHTSVYYFHLTTHWRYSCATLWLCRFDSIQFRISNSHSIVTFVTIKRFLNPHQCPLVSEELLL